MHTAGKRLKKHRVPKLPYLLKILTLKVSDYCKGKEQAPRRKRILGANASGGYKSIVKLLHRILPGTHEIFEISRRLHRWWGTGHGVPVAGIFICLDRLKG